MLGEPLTFTSTIDGDDIAQVDVRHPSAGQSDLDRRQLPATQINNIYQAQADIDISSSAAAPAWPTGTSAPNTHFDYQFRVDRQRRRRSLRPGRAGRRRGQRASRGRR